jgi:hypothetical protein
MVLPEQQGLQELMVLTARQVLPDQQELQELTALQALPALRDQPVLMVRMEQMV